MEADNIGKEVAVIPNSSYAKFPAPHFIGNGCRAGAILIVSKDKQRAQVGSNKIKFSCRHVQSFNVSFSNLRRSSMLSWSDLELP